MLHCHAIIEAIIEVARGGAEVETVFAVNITFFFFKPRCRTQISVQPLLDIGSADVRQRGRAKALYGPRAAAYVR